MPKTKRDELGDLRALDINEVFDHLDDADCPIDCINDFLILDSAYGYQSATEGILNHSGFTDITDSEWEACDKGIEAAMRSINTVFKRLDIDLEIVEVDLVEQMGWMLINRGANASKIAKKIKKGKL